MSFVFVLFIYYGVVIFLTSPHTRTIRKLLVVVPIMGFLTYLLSLMVMEIFK